MNKTRLISVLSAFALAFGMLTFSSAPTQVARAQAIPPVYNIYATDAYMQMADGTVHYFYGFVGGRQGVPITIQPSFDVKKWIQPANILVPGGAPNPTAGAITPAEAVLAGRAQFPAPIISAAVGEVVEIRLKNLGVAANKKAPNDPHSIHLHGLDVDAANDGVPETSLGAVPATLAAPGAGNVVVYMFMADHPGTYMYHCHQEASIHVAMGMYGALVIYNPGEAGAVSGPGTGQGSLHGWQYDKDVVLLLSEMDIRQNLAEADNNKFNAVTYQPQYFFINGLSFPQTIHVPPPILPAQLLTGSWFGDWLQAHPGYDPLIMGSVSSPSSDGTPGHKILLRVINMGFQTHPMHMHGFHGKIIGSDARAWTFANDSGVFSGFRTPWDQGMEKNTLLVGSGETYEWLLDFGQQAMYASSYAPNATYYASGAALGSSTYTPGSESRYYDGTPACQTSLAAVGAPLPALNAPVTNLATGCPAIPDPLIPPPNNQYIGGPVVAGAVGHPDTAQYFPFHNHEDYKATNNGVYPGGMFTMLVTTP